MTKKRILTFRRRIIRVGHSRAVTLPIDWAKDSLFVTLEINSQGAIILIPGGENHDRPGPVSREKSSTKATRN